ncbi:winged helix-turn-helix transcriptional regulator [Paradevosia shaoguanensis]|uniref:Helix-turn-helix transcriptional regulator n=1 Tax=Paradevosia shaoguanensis TaxID=1335043 RepID=A0AA41QPJ2_9HYPH|nr:helix-turn-helix domain-containing protein [Paradevosia shaoguanensis]MCF1744172.1 helix-turn-helix transcriptional regulator [Paradevosia shaoguanensis]MCI0128655.1 helix-turn-helix transcriptional regulator [Paradevosia shaoguanensis]QMV03836.1 transcriptional regulator [Devosia sp. D6-9]
MALSTSIQVPGKPEFYALTNQPIPLPTGGDTRTFLALIGDKWTLRVIAQLVAGKRRFNELRKLVVGISQKVLAATLRSLEREGLVKRTFFPVIPPRVEYELTEIGMRFLQALGALRDFAVENRFEIEAARRRFDAELDIEPPAQMLSGR